jgi:hypothetical protein
MITVKREPSIVTQKISLDVGGPGNQQSTGKEIYGTYPILYLKGLPIESSQLRYFKLNSNNFLPEIEATFIDPLATYKSENFPLDNEIMSVYINSRTEKLVDIKMDFKVSEFDYNRQTDEIYVKGFINIDDLWIEEILSYPDKTSYQVLEERSANLSLGYATNIENTNDKMTWICPGTNTIDFFQNVTKHGYLSDNSFMWSYIDFHYNLNYIDVEKEMEEDASQNKGILSHGVPMKEYDDLNREFDLVLFYGDIVHNNGTNIQLSDYEVYSQSTKTSLEEGYLKKVQYYDRYANWDKRSGGFIIQDLETAQAPDIASQNIVLKSQPNDTTNFFSKNQRFNWVGKIDTDNTYLNFNFANVQNKFNIAELSKIYIIATLSVPNFNLRKFLKIKLSINDVAKADNQAFLNKRLSGAWIITGITYEQDEISGFVQKVVLCKRELTNTNFNI